MSEGQTNNLVITEGSHVKITIARAIVAAGFLISIAASGAVAWYALNAKTDTHIADDHRHLDKDFDRTHGTPVGKWDLTARDEATTRALAALQEQADRTEKRLAAMIQAEQDRRPRYRP